jgi:phosphoglucomutase
MANLISPLAGKRPPREMLADPSHLVQEYYERRPEADNEAQLVVFGTSGHRGSSLRGTFTAAHILAITQAICDYRQKQHVDGPLFMGKDTHALSGPSQETALEVLAANGVETMIQPNDGFTPTPAVSHAILTYNRGRRAALGDGIIVTPSHNPPEDGGFKYNPVNGGPADVGVTRWIQDRANELLKSGNRGVKRMPYESAIKAGTTHLHDFLTPYVRALGDVIDTDVIRSSGVRIGVDPLGGASVYYWEPIGAFYNLDMTLVNPVVDPRFAFMTVDHDGKIRMDCSSPYAMAGLIEMKDRFDIAFANDADADRHGIVTRSVGLMNPNHYLSSAIHYLLTHRPGWPPQASVGKTLVSSGLIDRVVKALNRRLSEVPVGFKWFANGLLNGSYCFGGEESAGASFLKRDGTVWTTDKDGLIMNLLAAEITARTGKDPGELYLDLESRLGRAWYTRIDVPARRAERTAMEHLSPDAVVSRELAGEPILAKLSNAPGNGAPIGGLKVVAENGWFAARPSGTEDIYKIYAESFRDEKHLEAIVSEARAMVDSALARMKSLAA